jgi:competence protein ComEA
MAGKVRINLASAEELLELPGLGSAQAAAIVRFRADHGPIKDSAQLARILGGDPLPSTLSERADFSPAEATAPEAPGA